MCHWLPPEGLALYPPLEDEVNPMCEFLMMATSLL
jgi:hypothetical protein